MQEAFLGYSAVVHNKYPKGSLWQLIGQHKWLEKPLCVNQLVEGRTVFTDAGRKTKRAVCVWQQHDAWQQHNIQGEMGDSLQTLELKAVCWALQNWSKESLNIVSDSLYVVGVVQRIEDAQNRLEELFLQLPHTLRQQQHPYCIMQSHQWEKGLGEGNARADVAVQCISLHRTPLKRPETVMRSFTKMLNHYIDSFVLP